jgi:glycerate kinase
MLDGGAVTGHLLALPDKFRGTATAGEIATAIRLAAVRVGWSAEGIAVSDGGEGLLDCFGGGNQVTEVVGPLGSPVRAPWRLDGTRAVIEMATASGLALTDPHNDPVAASTAGTGQLIETAIRSGATDVIVGAGGSATTDGGRAAVDVLSGRAPLDGSRGYRVVVAADVEIRFLDAAAAFAPQKGAGRRQVVVLADRLRACGRYYADTFGVDVQGIVGGGAAGGLAGGLAALGAGVRPGFDLVAAELDLDTKIARADLVVTGEGRLDKSSALGKAPFGVLKLCATHQTPAALVVGQVADDVSPPAHTVSLADRFGLERAMCEPVAGVAEIVKELLTGPAWWTPE